MGRRKIKHIREHLREKYDLESGDEEDDALSLMQLEQDFLVPITDKRFTSDAVQLRVSDMVNMSLKVDLEDLCGAHGLSGNGNKRDLSENLMR
jgi:hypothetical protein